MRSQGIPEDYIKMKTFPFSLDGVAKDWLYLQLVLFNTWGDMKRMFLEKFFLMSKTATIKKEICGTRQHSRETLYEYWERFNKLCATCPHHHISLTMMDRSMIDVISGGAMMDKTPTTTRHLISNMASNTQQFGIRGAVPSRMVNGVALVDNLRLENQLTELTSLVRQLAVGKHQPSIAARVCGICTFVEHPTDMCPTLQETESDRPESVGSIGGYQYGKQPYSSRSYDIVPTESESRAISSSKIQTYPKHTSESKQLSTEPKIPGTTIPTTATTKSAITRQLTISRGPNEAVGNEQPGVGQLANIVSQLQSAGSIPLPFPTWTLSTRKAKTDEDLLKMFWKQILKYEKFLKELFMHKRKKMKGRMELGGIMSVVTKNEVVVESQQTLSKKCRDLETFSISCTIGECTFVDVMLDLGASINVMPTSIYKSLNFGDL
ncbi:hypothetical protein CR513_09872, partial [Mucuna pruriens]